MRLLGRNLSLVAGDLHLATSLSRNLRPKWVLLVQSRPKWVLLVQSRPKWALLIQSSTLLSLVRLGDGPLTRLSVPRTTHLARGVITHTHTHPTSSQNRQQRDDQQDEEGNFRPALLQTMFLQTMFLQTMSSCRRCSSRGCSCRRCSCIHWSI